MEATKCGFVAVVGRPNAGKSTLLNFLSDYKLAMVSKKAQATRKRMNIIVTHNDAQIVFVDTPGIHKKEKLLNQFMLDEALKALGDSDLDIFLAPVNDSLRAYEEFLTLRKDKEKKHIILLTKVDRVSNERVLQKLGEFNKYADKFSEIIPFSVKRGGATKEMLLNTIVKYLPVHPWLYDGDILTTENIRDIYKELIREAIFEKASDEIPYESDVLIDKIDESEKLDVVTASIVVEKETQKRMLIGKGAQSIKRIGKYAREELEKFSGKKIYLDLNVTVKKGWSKNRDLLENLGYIF
ncbi:MAG TPA: GTPase Era [Nitratifractor sp.]|nr:GTPase Era [Nitratifractor sp.]